MAPEQPVRTCGAYQLGQYYLSQTVWIWSPPLHGNGLIRDRGRNFSLYKSVSPSSQWLLSPARPQLAVTMELQHELLHWNKGSLNQILGWRLLVAPN